ncbi:MAG: PAS domain-containing protein [Desulfobacter sp.]|nr:MAG: PAS domain-containing protein [Desulfobacter sp.]
MSEKPTDKSLERHPRDIRRQKEVQDALAVSEKRFRTILEAMHDPLYICSPEDKIEFVNKAMRDKIGRDAVGEICYRVMHGLEERCPWCAHDQVRGNEHVTYEITSPGDGRVYHITASPLDRGNGGISQLTIYRDITAKRELEKQRLQAKKLESVAILAGGLAHDFNNLLFTIMGNIDLAITEVDSDTRTFLNEAYKASKKAQKLTRSLITFSKGGDPVKGPGCIKELLADVSEKTLSDPGIDCRLDIPDTLYPVRFDYSQLYHALDNIMTNALESMDGKGKITVSAENVSLGYKTELPLSQGPYVKISVKDQGRGIPEENLPLIFDPYFSTKETGNQKGMGLGLATTYAVIAKHDGHIHAASEPGKGSEFAIYLPGDDQH